tara:strand:- start:493 stop:717 length:225 start_codon:yes stop_codon:yes gene_type:complete
MKNLLFNPTHMTFETDGTGYDLVLVNDPYGGVLVIWPVTGYLWRWYMGERLAPLSSNCNPFDADNIFAYLEETQ